MRGRRAEAPKKEETQQNFSPPDNATTHSTHHSFGPGGGVTAVSLSDHPTDAWRPAASGGHRHRHAVAVVGSQRAVAARSAAGSQSAGAAQSASAAQVRHRFFALGPQHRRVHRPYCRRLHSRSLLRLSGSCCSGGSTSARARSRPSASGLSGQRRTVHPRAVPLRAAAARGVQPHRLVAHHFGAVSPVHHQRRVSRAHRHGRVSGRHASAAAHRPAFVEV
jgi:hypothetical protein